MKQSPMSRAVTFGVAAAMGLVSFAACSHVTAVNQPLNYVANKTPIEVWVVRRHNDTTYRMSQPRLQGDTLIGFISANDAPATLTQYAEIPIGDVRQMRAREAAPVRTGLLVAGITGTIVVAWTQLVGNGNAPGIGPGHPGFCECDFDDICGCP
jgi:hypothetical protein